MNFEQEFFQKIDFSKSQISRFFISAKRDLKIAEDSDVPEIKFKFSYDALLKTGIALIAGKGFKIRGKTGHHVKIIEKLSEILNDHDVPVWANRMRQERNLDLYSGGEEFSEKESSEYFTLVKKVMAKAFGGK